VPLVFALFFVSGAACLILETVVRRLVGLYAGTEATATSLTLALFLGGLAAGAAAAGPWADRARRPLRLYALLEAGAGLTSAAAVALLAHGRDVLLAPVRACGPGALGDLVTAGIVAAIVLPPATLMGGTLPAIARYAVDEASRIVTPVARLYAINTLGAAVGAAVAGFVLFEALGISETGYLGAALSLAASGAAIAAGRGLPAADPARTRASAPARAGDVAAPGVALACAASCGIAALGYEVIWTRLLAVPLRSYAYSFSLMLALLLLGIVAGAALAGRHERASPRVLAMLAWAQILGAAWVAASVAWLPWVLRPAAEGSGFGAFLWNGLLRATPVVLPPTLASGLAFPLAIGLYVAAPGRAASGIGRLYAANTAGAITGALAAALLLMPSLGASRALALLAAIGAAGGAVAAAALPRGRAARAAAIAVLGACLLAAAATPTRLAAAFSRPARDGEDASQRLYFAEGANDTVSVVRRSYGFKDPDAKSMIVNGIAMTATVKPVWRYMAAEGHLPALHAPPGRALVVCVGTGITLAAVASHRTVDAVDAIDLSGAVLGALPVFRRENEGVAENPKVRLARADGRHHLATTPLRYALITLEPPPPVVAGSVHLYTLDFYELCKRRLAPGGVLAQWLPLHAQSEASARAVARTFLDAFPHAALWLPSIRDAVLIGSEAPLHLDPSRLLAAYADPATRANLAAAYLETPEALLGTYLLDRDGIARWSAGADRITDDRPSMEFFLRYGRTMSDREIGALVDVPPGSLSAMLGDGAPPGLLEAARAARAAHRAYLRAEIDADVAAARAAAIPGSGTRFGLYRLGCDAPQLETLRRDTSEGEPWRRQLAACERLVPGALP